VYTPKEHSPDLEKENENELAKLRTKISKLEAEIEFKEKKFQQFWYRERKSENSAESLTEFTRENERLRRLIVSKEEVIDTLHEKSAKDHAY